MTHINVIPPGDLTDEHLLAEWRHHYRRPVPPTFYNRLS